MAVEIVMPRFGWTMEEGLLTEWLKQDGDPVKAGEVLFTVESDKALNEVESLEAGILRLPPDSPPPNSTVRVGTVLAYIVQPGERAPFEDHASEAAQPVMSAPPNVAGGAKGAAPSIQSTELPPTISPRARRIAGELGVDITRLKGSGRTGRIVERDVRAASPTIRSVPGTAAETAQPLSSVRRLIAERMMASAHTTAPVTLTTEVDATELVRLREQLKGDPIAAAQPIPTYTDLMAKLAAHALLEHPALNAHLEGDAIVQSAAVHIGLAVDTERGLLVPVLREAHSKSLRQIAQAAAALVASARAGRLGADELRGSTFTITNLGMYEIDAFTPIINLPECAILGLGRIVPKHVVLDAAGERLAIRQMMFLSLTFDHRLVDGAPAARFLQRIKQLVEQPYVWLVT